ncbi:MAG: phosphoribosylanthranilate isomerase, partial [Gammaproteobacteria bacterium]|nr:phosphoribosylanthranilate isomerase [Gammaproteobacteria bacterium]
MKPFIKICGITNSHDLDYVTSLDIDAVGFNLFFESKRQVNTSDLNQLYKLVPEHIHTFLIFVNAKEEFV